tara:strand:- start:40 stop:810 length:771 start_codon:yes stop_codon:yes gene_type:complete
LSKNKLLGTVLVTGAAGAIGYEITRFLNESGYEVIGTDHPDKMPKKDLLDFCCSWIPQDLENLCRDESNVKEFCDSVLLKSRNSPFVGIVNNAAIQILKEFSNLTLKDWMSSLEVNLIAPILLGKNLLNELAKNSGSIVNIGSIHSCLTKSNFVAYATSKAALSGLTRSMAVELGNKVRVNGVDPAAISTPMLDIGFLNKNELKLKLNSYHPTGFIGNPKDVALSVKFLLDSSNSFLNGCIIDLNGGIKNRLHDPL